MSRVKKTLTALITLGVLVAIAFTGYYFWLGQTFHPTEYISVLARIDACKEYLTVDENRLLKMKKKFEILKQQDPSIATGAELFQLQYAMEIAFSSEGGESRLKAECRNQVWNTFLSIGSSNPLGLK